ncbi:MAG: phytoene desaturase family protein [Acidimicrobiia bacterium]
MPDFDAVVVGAGPNGLAAAVTLAGEGCSVLVVEAAPTIGGGARTAELTLPGFRHDVCSAVHPTGVASPFFRSLPLERHGLTWLQPEVPFAHPLDGGRAVWTTRSVDETAGRLGQDEAAYRRLVGRMVAQWGRLESFLLGPRLAIPAHPVAAARFGLVGGQPATRVARALVTEEARALFAGCAAHAVLPLDRLTTASFGMIYPATAHAVGWPMAAGGSQAIVDALASVLAERGGRVQTGVAVRSLHDLPTAKVVLFDVVPGALADIAGARLPDGYVRRLRRFRHGPGAFKVDYALDGPVPWANQELARAGTVHVGGTLEEVAEAERAVWRGDLPQRPFVIVAQPSVVDPSRAPAGQQALWAYCHVPHGWPGDATDAIEGQIERFAPGFRERVLARHTHGPAELEAWNANYVGGDITGGAHTPRQLFFRPVPRLDPYSTPARGIYLCSASTPPGAGVHGMCGHLAARSALRRGLG